MFYILAKCNHKLCQGQRQAVVPTRRDERYLGMSHYLLKSSYHNENIHVYIWYN